MIYAVYRCLYGEDFIQESINSISDYVDKIFIFWDNKAWAGVDHCIYKGEKIIFPQQFDNILEKIKALNNPKVELIHDHVYNNINQFTHFVNDLILPNYGKPKAVMAIEVDHVFKKEQLELVLEEFNHLKGATHAPLFYSEQIEIWKGLKHRIPERERESVVLWDMEKLNFMPQTLRQANTCTYGKPCVAHGREVCPLSVPSHRLKGKVHNYGFAISEKVMYWKHMTALGFSQKIGDSGPNEDWFEKVWKTWDFEKNNKNLEISKGYEHFIPYAEPYNVEEHPEEILRTRVME